MDIQMIIIDNKTDQEIIDSILAEVAKSKNELQCGQRDIDKANSRMGFVIVLLNELIKRKLNTTD